MIISKTKQQ